jgi:hypothetical protein
MQAPEGFGCSLPCIICMHAIYLQLTCTQCACVCRFRVPEGFGRPLPSVADGGAAPTPHHLALRIWKRKESGAVLQVRLLGTYTCPVQNLYQTADRVTKGA